VTDGQTLQMRDRISGRLIRFVVTGQYRPRQVSSPYWNLNEVALSGSSTVSGFTTYGPLVVQASAFAGPLTVNGGSWLARPEVAGIPGDELTPVAASVAGLQQSLQQQQQLPNLTLITSLPSVLDGVASNLNLARSLLAICAVLLFLLAGAALLAVARLLAGQREGESAMLTARGATRWQLVRLTAAEAVPLCALAAAAGGEVLALDAGQAAGIANLRADQSPRPAAAMAGPALSLHARTQALRQLLAGFPSTTMTVQVAATGATSARRYRARARAWPTATSATPSPTSPLVSPRYRCRWPAATGPA